METNGRVETPECNGFVIVFGKIEMMIEASQKFVRIQWSNRALPSLWFNTNRKRWNMNMKRKYLGFWKIQRLFEDLLYIYIYIFVYIICMHINMYMHTYIHNLYVYILCYNIFHYIYILNIYFMYIYFLIFKKGQGEVLPPLPPPKLRTWYRWIKNIFHLFRCPFICFICLYLQIYLYIYIYIHIHINIKKYNQKYKYK